MRTGAAPAHSVGEIDGQAGMLRQRPSDGRRFALVGLGCLAAGVGLLLLSFNEAVPLLSLSLMLLTLAIAVRSMKDRWLAIGYAAVLAVSFVLAPLLNGRIPSTAATVWSVLALWLAGWAIGNYLTARLGSSPDGPTEPVSRPVVDVLHRRALLVIGVLSLVVQWMLIRKGAVGYGAQVRGVISPGPLAIFASVGPAALASVYVMTLAQGARPARRLAMTFLILLQAVALAGTGFRGAGPIYLLTVWFVVKRWVPLARWNPRRVIGAALGVTMMLALFNFAAGVRQQTAPDNRSSSLGSLVLTPVLATKRLDLLGPAHAAVERADLPTAQETVSGRSQLVAFVPRVLWPSKASSNYGQDVSHVFFDIPTIYRTSSSISWIGDLFVQGGPVLIALTAVVAAVGFNRLVRWRSQLGPLSIVIYFLVVQVLLTVEVPLLISLATNVRTFLTLTVAMWAARMVLRVVKGQRAVGIGTGAVTLGARASLG